MNDNTKYVGLDVSKEKIAIAVADGNSRESARYWGEIPHRIEDIRKLIRRLGDPGQMQVCYEAGPTGYLLERRLATGWGRPAWWWRRP